MQFTLGDVFRFLVSAADCLLFTGVGEFRSLFGISGNKKAVESVRIESDREDDWFEDRGQKGGMVLWW